MHLGWASFLRFLSRPMRSAHARTAARCRRLRLAIVHMWAETPVPKAATGEDRMGRISRLVAAGIVLAALSVAAATAQQLDPKIVTFKLPDQIVWKDNPKGGNRSAVLQGDPSKPGPTRCSCNGCPAT
jgi:hypothetical protein